MRMKARDGEGDRRKEKVSVTCGQDVSRCQSVMGGVTAVITVQICLLPLECHSRRTRPASLTWSGGDRGKHQHKLK